MQIIHFLIIKERKGKENIVDSQLNWCTYVRGYNWRAICVKYGLVLLFIRAYAQDKD